MKGLYFILLGFSLSFPLIRSFEPRVYYFGKWKYLFPAIGVSAILFIAWDIYFTKIGIWGFNEKYTLGVRLFSLPLEECLFFLVVPFSCLFIYACVVHFLPGLKTNNWIKFSSLVLSLSLLTLSVYYYQHSYTFWCFGLAGIVLLVVSLLNPGWLAGFWLAFAFDLVPFIIVNGILTGSWIKEPIVWYNDSENLQIRLLTIPVEDFVYSFLLILVTTALFEKLQIRNKVKTIKSNTGL